MMKVFLSYSFADRRLADQVAARLEKRGMSIWNAQSLDLLGANVMQAIRKALRESDAVVVLISEQALRSQWVQFELGAAIGVGKRVAPVIVGLKDADVALPSFLRGIKYLDARGQSPQMIATELERVISADALSAQTSRTARGTLSKLRLTIAGKRGTLQKVLTLLAEAQCDIIEVHTAATVTGGHVAAELVVDAPDVRSLKAAVRRMQSHGIVLAYSVNWVPSAPQGKPRAAGQAQGPAVPSRSRRRDTSGRSRARSTRP